MDSQELHSDTSTRSARSSSRANIPDEEKRRIELRRFGERDIPAAIAQCGIGVRYLMSGPREMFDVADVLLDGQFVREIKADARREALREAEQAIAASARQVDDGMVELALGDAVSAERAFGYARYRAGLANAGLLVRALSEGEQGGDRG